MNRDDTINVTRIETLRVNGRTQYIRYDINEEEFKTLLVQTLTAVASHAQSTNFHNTGDEILAGATALEYYMKGQHDDMSLLGTFLTANQLVYDNDAGPFSCPCCSESDMDELEHNDDDDEITCQSCGTTYTTDSFSPTDVRPEWFRLGSGLTFRIYAEGGAYVSERK